MLEEEVKDSQKPNFPRHGGKAKNQPLKHKPPHDHILVEQVEDSHKPNFLGHGKGEEQPPHGVETPNSCGR